MGMFVIPGIAIMAVLTLSDSRTGELAFTNALLRRDQQLLALRYEIFGCKVL